MTEINENGEVTCSYCNGTGEKIIEIHETDCSTFGKLFKREPKIRQCKSVCEYCHGTKLISWIDDIVVPIKLSPTHGKSGWSGVSGYGGAGGCSGSSGWISYSTGQAIFLPQDNEVPAKATMYCKIKF